MASKSKSWLWEYIQTKVLPQACIQIKDLTQGIHSNQRSNPMNTVKSKSEPRAYNQIKRIAPGIHAYVQETSNSKRKEHWPPQFSSGNAISRSPTFHNFRV